MQHTHARPYMVHSASARACIWRAFGVHLACILQACVRAFGVHLACTLQAHVRAFGVHLACTCVAAWTKGQEEARLAGWQAGWLPSC